MKEDIEELGYKFGRLSIIDGCYNINVTCLCGRVENNADMAHIT